ncbi:MAG TPA: LacI family DNA-binding transcriptional regulator [Silvibacterium sp.]|nr:LacI family DNA-binding transcriptional regulator [Silvibacterium sp.]
MPAKKRPRQSRSEKRRLDIRDVAKHARVSIATVSRTINRVPTVDAQLAERVWKAIGELNYFPNTQARALVSGRTRLLGLLVSEITNPFFPELIEGFEEIAVANGYEILIGSTSYDLARMATCIRRMLERNVEGVAVMTFGIERPLLEELSSRDIPMVFVDAGPPGPLIRALIVDYRRGIREGVQHLAALGHRNIAFISGPLGQGSAQARKTAFIESVKEIESAEEVESVDEIGLTPRPAWLIEGDHTLEGGMRAMTHLLSLPERPTAVMCSNDMTAIGALRVLARAGLGVPRDMSVIGFDDIHLAEFVYPPLTTVRMSRKDLARGAFESLRSVAENLEPSQQRSWTIPTRLIIRESTGSAPKLPLKKPPAKRSAARAPSRKRAGGQ